MALAVVTGASQGIGLELTRHLVARGDGDLDLMLHFSVVETGIMCGDTEVTLTGETSGGEAIAGSNSIRTVECP